MARSVTTDFIHSMRFQVVVAGDNPDGFLAAPGRADAGFTLCTTPSVTMEALEYREGTYIYTRKYPGIPTVDDISMSRGVARGDSSFWAWMRRCIEGTGEYRVDLDIKHFHRDNSLTRGVAPTGDTPNLTTINTETPGRTYHVKEALPTRHKVAGDLDATAGEISIMELDIAYEHFEVEEHTA